MAVYNRTKVGFVYDTMSEFIHLWRSGVEATVKFECKDGKVAFSMSSGPLGYPEDRHPKVEVKKRRRKSANRTSRNNARAARYQAAQAAQAALASHELTPSAARPVASPVLSTSLVPPGQDVEEDSGQDVPGIAPPALSSAGEDHDKTPAQSPRPLLSSATPPLHHSPPLPSNSHRELQPGSLASSGEPEQEMEHRAEQPHCEAVSEENRTSEEAVWETMESMEDEDEDATRTVYLPDLSAAPNFWDFSQKEQRKYEAAGAAAQAGHQQSRGRDHGGHASAPPEKSEDQLRDEPQTSDSLMDSPRTIINQELSSSTQSSPRVEQEASQFSSTSPSEPSSPPQSVETESESESESEFQLPNMCSSPTHSSPPLSSPRGELDGLTLERFLDIEPCSDVPPHSCREYWYTTTAEECQQIEKWLKQCGDHRTDIEWVREAGKEYPPDPFSCSLLRSLRCLEMSRTFERLKSRQEGPPRP